MLPQVIILSQNPSTRKVYHRLLSETACELFPTKNVAEALVCVAAGRTDALVFDDSIETFEICTLFEVLQAKPSWSSIQLFAQGYAQNGHILPVGCKNGANTKEVVSFVQAFVSSMTG